VVRVADVVAEKRPRWKPSPGVASTVREVSKIAGLAQMGVSERTVLPGDAGSKRHFHTVEEEWAYVLSGEGTARVGPLSMPVRAGHFVAYPPGPCPHHFIASGTEPLVFLEGGERRKDEERGWYVDQGLVFSKSGIEEAPGPPPPEEGNPSQCVHLDDAPLVAFDHEVEATSHRGMKELSEGTGLVRQVVTWAHVRRDDQSTAFHSHTRTDEWVFILDGAASLRVGDERCEVGPGDFVAHPAGGLAHVMEPRDGDLTYLMGGQRDAADVVLYPEHGMQRRDGRVVPL
jgi:uncharacterized cupin superfamily protein